MSNWNHVADYLEFNLEISTDELLSRVELNQRVLDFGCGYGRISNQLNGAGYLNLTGVDTSIEMISRGERDFPLLDLRFIDSGRLPFADGEFDCVVTCAVFTCIPDADAREAVVTELRRVLKPNGLIHIAEFSSQEEVKFTSRFGVSMWYGTQQKLEEMLSSFSIESSKVEETETMSGGLSKACRIFARKAISQSI